MCVTKFWSKHCPVIYAQTAVVLHGTQNNAQKFFSYSDGVIPIAMTVFRLYYKIANLKNCTICSAIVINKVIKSSIYSQTSNYTHLQCLMCTFAASLLVSDPSILDGLDLTEEEKNVLIDNINRRLTPQAVKIRAGTETLYASFIYKLVHNSVEQLL